MSGVLIRDMQMPSSCGECPLLYDGAFNGEPYPCVCHAAGFLIKPSETDLRDGMCPLVYVPDDSRITKVEAALYNIEEIHPNATVQIWRNSVTGDESIGWWDNDHPPAMMMD